MTRRKRHRPWFQILAFFLVIGCLYKVFLPGFEYLAEEMFPFFGETVNGIIAIIFSWLLGAIVLFQVVLKPEKRY